MYGTTVALNSTNFIGMDLHSNNVVICVLQNAANQAGQLIKPEFSNRPEGDF